MIQILLIAFGSMLVQFVLPWWSLALVAFAVCFWRSPAAGQAFWYGFAGVAIIWLIYALLVHTRTDGIFTGRMSQLLFKANAPTVLIIVTTIVGGLVGGMAGLSGYFVRQTLVNQSTMGKA